MRLGEWLANDARKTFQIKELRGFALEWLAKAKPRAASVWQKNMNDQSEMAKAYLEISKDFYSRMEEYERQC